MTPGKLLIEHVDTSSLEYLVENKTDREKVYKIKGPFLQADARNRNGRIYPYKILSEEVKRYDAEFIQAKRSIGSLDHSDSPTVKLSEACHIVTELTMVDKIGYGTAKMLDTAQGKIAKTLMDEGIQLAVSSKAIGSLSSDGIVGDNFKLYAIDLVLTPSLNLAYVESIMESQDYIINGNQLVAVNVENFKKDLVKNGTRNLYNDLTKFLNNLSRKI